MRALKGYSVLPLMAVSLSFMAGIGAASLIEKTTGFWLGWAAASAVLLLLPRLFRWAAVHADGLIRAVLNRLPRFSQWISKRLIGPPAPGKRSPIVLGVVCLIALFLGAARYQAAQPSFDQRDLAWYNDGGEAVAVVGVVVLPPDVRDTHVQVTVQSEQVDLTGSPRQDVSGRVLAYLPTGTAVHYGDRVRLWGQLQTPPEDEDFSYKDYLARQKVFSYMPYAAGEVLESGHGSPILRSLFSFREKGMALIYRALPDPAASLLAGIVLGYESGIPDDVDQAFKDTGTTHIIAISGFNITIVAGLFAMLFGRLLGERRGAVAALIAISLYTMLVGADAAVVRAAIMGGFSLFARQVGRRQHGLNSLAITGGLMALFNPLVLWDVGFQLSFAATLGLILYAGPWEEALLGWFSQRMPPDRARKLTGPVSEYFLLTLAAQLTTLPLIVYHFGRLSLVSLPANVAILPAQPPVMSLGGLAVLLGAVWFPLGQGLAYAVWPFLAYTIGAVEWFARWDAGVRVVGQVSLPWVFVFYLGLLALTIYWEQVVNFIRKYFSPALAISVLLVGAVLVWQAALQRPDGRLHMTMLDVGAGEAILIQTPEGRYVLVGGGESASQLSTGLGRVLPLFHRELDVLVVAGTAADQVQALPNVLLRYLPAEVWWAGDVQASRPARELHAWLAEEGIPVAQMVAGQTLDLGEGAVLSVVRTSESGATLVLSWGDFRAVLPVGGAVGLQQDPEMRRWGVGATAVLLASSGATEENPAAWLSTVAPRMSLLSLDPLNRSGWPDPETLVALEGVPMFRTDMHGWVELVSDGEQLWVYTEK